MALDNKGDVGKTYKIVIPQEQLSDILSRMFYYVGFLRYFLHGLFQVWP